MDVKNKTVLAFNFPMILKIMQLDKGINCRTLQIIRKPNSDTIANFSEWHVLLACCIKLTLNPQAHSQISPLSLISTLFSGKKVNKPSLSPPLRPLPSPLLFFTNEYLPTGSSDLILILGCMTSNFLYSSFSTLYSSSLRRTDTTVFAKLNLKKPRLK